MLMQAALTMALAATTQAAPVLNDETFDHWRDYVRPEAHELAWKEVPWETSFWSAVTIAQREQKPLLVWAMNGHPLACT